MKMLGSYLEVFFVLKFGNIYFFFGGGGKLGQFGGEVELFGAIEERF